MENINEQIKPISLAVSMRELFQTANKYLYFSYAIQAFLFIVNIFLIAFKPQESNEYIWLLFSFSIAMLVLSNFILYKSKKYYDIGEGIRKMDMVERIFPNAANKAEKSYLISKIPSSIIEKAQINPNETTDYLSGKQDKYGKLIENIQENSFFTSEIMRHYSKIILTVIIIISILLSMSIVYGFFILSESNIDNNLTKDVAVYIALLINFIFTLNIIDHYILFNKKAGELKKIDENLNSIKNNPQEDDIITTFTEYNCILCNALPCPNFVYKLNKSKLNRVWYNRINNG